jgi:hypothetical protein
MYETVNFFILKNAIHNPLKCLQDTLMGCDLKTENHFTVGWSGFVLASESHLYFLIHVDNLKFARIGIFAPPKEATATV